MATTVVEVERAAPPADIPSVLTRAIRGAMATHPTITDVVVASTEGLVIAYHSRRGQAGLALSALAPLINDAGQTVFRELTMNGLGEVFLVGSEGVVYLVRCSMGKCFVMVAARGMQNLGMLRLAANEIETETSQALLRYAD